VPALVLHTAIAAVVLPMVCGTLTRDVLMLPWPIRRMYWLMYIIYYVLSLFAGMAWAKFLDTKLFNTSRFVVVLPGIWFLLNVPVRARGEFFMNPVFAWLPFMWFVPFLCSLGYALGAWIRRSTEDEVPDAINEYVDAAALPDHKMIVGKAVKLWRAGRSLDDAEEERGKTADSSLRSE
jgi:hypothetical protein